MKRPTGWKPNPQARYSIVQGHALEELRKMPEASCHCAISSPPYWGMRSYGTPPMVWGGLPNCEHSWDAKVLRGGPAGGQGKDGQCANRSANAERGRSSDSLGQFCRYCKAWRGDLGLEPHPEMFVRHLVEIFEEVRRVLRPDGTLWLNLGDSRATGGGKVGQHPGGGKQGERFSRDGTFTQPNRLPLDGYKSKDLMLLPEQVAMALRDSGWYLRQKIPWIKRNGFCESVKDRPTTTIETVFMFSKSERCYYDHHAVLLPPAADSVARAKRGRGPTHKWVDGPGDQTICNDMSRAASEEGRFRRSTDWFMESWQGLLGDDNGDPLAFVVNVAGFPGPHFAVMPEKLAEPMVRAGCPEDGTVLDPFTGAGTTGVAALRLRRRFLGIELSEKYLELADQRLYEADAPLLNAGGLP